MDFLKLLEDKTFIEEWTVLDNRVWETGFYYKIRVILKNESLLQASEYKDIQERNYSFHWQDKEGQLLFDGTMHHTTKNFPLFLIINT